MATIPLAGKDTSDINLTTPQPQGILHPVLKHRFRVHFNFQSYQDYALSAQVLYCGRNIASCTLNIVLEQDAVTDAIPKFLEHLMVPSEQDGPKLEISVDCLAGDDGVLFTDHFYACKLVFHKFDLDYRVSDFAAHELTFLFNHTKHERGPASR